MMHNTVLFLLCPVVSTFKVGSAFSQFYLFRKWSLSLERNVIHVYRFYDFYTIYVSRKIIVPIWNNVELAAPIHLIKPEPLLKITSFEIDTKISTTCQNWYLYQTGNTVYLPGRATSDDVSCSRHLFRFIMYYFNNGTDNSVFVHYQWVAS